MDGKYKKTTTWTERCFCTEGTFSSLILESFFLCNLQTPNQTDPENGARMHRFWLESVWSCLRIFEIWMVAGDSLTQFGRSKTEPGYTSRLKFAILYSQPSHKFFPNSPETSLTYKGDGDIFLTLSRKSSVLLWHFLTQLLFKQDLSERKIWWKRSKTQLRSFCTWERVLREWILWMQGK